MASYDSHIAQTSYGGASSSVSLTEDDSSSAAHVDLR